MKPWGIVGSISMMASAVAVLGPLAGGHQIKKLVAIAALAGALLLSACAPPEPAIDKDAVYLKLVHDSTSNKSSDSDLVQMAKSQCEALGTGTTKKELQNAIADLDYSQATKVELARIVGFGIGVYCPEFK